MSLCNQGVAKAKTAMEKAQQPSFGGGAPSNENIEVMMNTFYRSASIGFAQGTKFGTQFGAGQTTYGGFGNAGQ